MDTITTYSIEELKAHCPEAFERVLTRWAEDCAAYDTPWQGEAMDSLRAVIDASGAKLADWSIGAYDGNSYIRVSLPEDLEGMEPAQARRWYLANVLRPNGYVKKNGHADFPGHCKFTGYCADDDFLESVWKSLGTGNALKYALESLADDVRRHFEDAMEQQQGEESMMANMEGAQFTEGGTQVK